jgi:hypothetical protein
LGCCSREIAVPRRLAPESGSEFRNTSASGGNAASTPQIRDRTTPRNLHRRFRAAGDAVLDEHEDRLPREEQEVCFFS